MENNKEERTEFAKVIYGLAENFSGNVTENGLGMRFEALKSFSLKQIKDASMIILRTRKYTTMPTVADFIDAIEGNPDEKAEIQKSVVMGCLNAYHPRQGFKDPITQAVIDQIGWRKLGLANKKEIPFLLNDFKEMYKSYNKAASGNMINAPDNIKGLLNGMVKEIT